MRIKNALIPAALVAAGAAAALSGCTGGTDAVPAPSATAVVPAATDEGAIAISDAGDCSAVGEMFAGLTAGLELQLDAPSSASVFCDWGDAAGGERSFSIELLASADPVPSPDEVTAAGGTVVDAAPVSDAGGIAYVIAPGPTAFALTVVLPTHSASATLLGSEVGQEQLGALTDGMDRLLGLPHNN